jgi:hypothetical protein
MRLHNAVVVTLMVIGISRALANAPFATAEFGKIVPKTGKVISTSTARLDDYVCVYVEDSSTPDGDHDFRLTIYDGGGNQVFRSEATVTAKDKKWHRRVCYKFAQDHDRPGTWWYVAELDDEPLVSKDIVVSAAK